VQRKNQEWLLMELVLVLDVADKQLHSVGSLLEAVGLRNPPCPGGCIDFPS